MKPLAKATLLSLLCVPCLQAQMPQEALQRLERHTEKTTTNVVMQSGVFYSEWDERKGDFLFNGTWVKFSLPQSTQELSELLDPIEPYTFSGTPSIGGGVMMNPTMQLGGGFGFGLGSNVPITNMFASLSDQEYMEALNRLGELSYEDIRNLIFNPNGSNERIAWTSQALSGILAGNNPSNMDPALANQILGEMFAYGAQVQTGIPIGSVTRHRSAFQNLDISGLDPTTLNSLRQQFGITPSPSVFNPNPSPWALDLRRISALPDEIQTPEDFVTYWGATPTAGSYWIDGTQPW